MKRFCLSISLILVLFDCFSQVSQFPQTPVSLNPSLAGSAGPLRASIGFCHLNQKDTATSDYNNGINIPYSYENQYSLTTINIDKFVRKINSGIGFTLNAGNFKVNIVENLPQGQFQKIDYENNMLQIGVCIAPKFTFAMEDNRNILKSTWSPAIELSLKTVNVNENLNFKNNNYGNNHAGNITSLSYRLGVSRIGRKSILGVYYGNQKIINLSNATYEVKRYWPNSSQDTVYVKNTGGYGIRFNNFFGFHYGLTMYLNSSKTFVYIPHLNYIRSFSDSFSPRNPIINLTEFGNNQINIVNNFRYKNFLTGLSVYANGLLAVVPFSLGYQSSELKIIASYNIAIDYYGEITCSYVFK